MTPAYFESLAKASGGAALLGNDDRSVRLDNGGEMLTFRENTARMIRAMLAVGEPMTAREIGTICGYSQSHVNRNLNYQFERGNVIATRVTKCKRMRVIYTVAPHVAEAFGGRAVA